MVNIMKFLIANGIPEEEFLEYKSLRIYPNHIHKTKSEHKVAIFTLAYDISRILAEHGIVSHELKEKFKKIKDSLNHQR